MTELQHILELIQRTPNCELAEPRGQPVLREGDRLPNDLAEFYSHCGGVSFLGDCDYPIRIVGPNELVRSNPEIVGAEYPEDITDTWYIVARGGAEEMISIDCSRDRLGRCYDSFWDRHGVAGGCRIVARSFTELIQRLFGSKGGHWYWLAADSPDYGDAYDGMQR